jgi:uncharacterized membrane protein YjjB (DUF3815 family)
MVSRWILWIVAMVMCAAWAMVFDHPIREWLIAVFCCSGTLFAQWLTETVIAPRPSSPSL